ncbi:MAG: hypothetical protein ACRDE2_07550, partial [Chitinophagaceae bacterium]
TYDIASALQEGKNIIAALVWNMAEFGPVAQITNQTGFLLQGDTKAEEIANTSSTWKVLHDTAYLPCAINMGSILRTYFVTGPGDEVNGKDYPWGWEKLNYNDSHWQQAKELYTPVVTQGYGTDNLWTMSPRTIPQMEEKLQRFDKVRRSGGINSEGSFLKGDHPLVIPAHTHDSILIDQSFETVGYPVLNVSGGKNSIIKITYAEALFNKEGQKGNRNDIKGKTIKGLYDIFYTDGGSGRTFSPLWIRAWRYVQLNIQTGDEPLTLNDFYGIYSTYPFVHKATFSSNDSSLEKIWEVGWRTARLCAGETYFDCPYYEQLQYEADTRIQALISLYNTGDDRLMKKAINDFYNSRVPDGLTQGRFPSSRLQVIPTFSLFWISMLHDYWMNCPDSRFITKYLDAANIILKWYEKHIDPSYNMLGPMDWWNFVDWNPAFPNGVPDGATDGHSSVITLQYVYTLRQAAQLFDYFGRKKLAQHYLTLANQLAKGTYQHCFDKQRMEMADTPIGQVDHPEEQKFSQHASIMGILATAIPVDEEKTVMKNVLYDSTLSQATFYFRFYLTRAMIKAGLGNLYYSQLTPWRDMLKIGLTTFAEKPEPTRSDCHGWSASPEYDFLATICGIMPDAPGFSKVKIEPHLGELKEVNASMPLTGNKGQSRGSIAVHLKRSGSNGIRAEITLPQDTPGIFIWNGKEVPLHGGEQVI